MTTSPKSRTKAPIKTTNKFKDFIKNPQFQPLLVIGVLLIAGAVVLVISMLKPHPFNGSRQTADTFMRAYANCDFKTAQKYYTVFQVNPDKSQEYQQSCVKGEVAFSFYKAENGIVEKKNGITIKNIGYLYNFTQKNIAGGQLLVYMEWIDTTHSWIVFSVTPTSPSPPGASQ